MLSNYFKLPATMRSTESFSRDGEDLILEFLAQNLNIEKTCLEVGASDGVADSNTLLLRQKYGFKALLIEPPGDHFDKLIKIQDENTLVECSFISHKGENTLDHFISKHFDRLGILSLDIDGNELEIFANMTSRPQIVVIEYNNQFPPHIAYQDPPDCLYFRHSAKAVYEIGKQKNYTTIHVSNDNLILIDNDLMSDAFKDLFVDVPVEVLSKYYASPSRKYYGLILTCKQYTNRHIFLIKPNFLLHAYAKILDCLAFFRAVKHGRFSKKYFLSDSVKDNIRKAHMFP